MVNDVLAYDVFKIKIYDANCKHANVLLHRCFVVYYATRCLSVKELSAGI